MFILIYIYPVPDKSIDEFLRIQREAEKIYLRYGTISDQTFSLENLEPKYSCIPFSKAVTLDKGEQAYLSITTFESSNHHDEVMKKVDADPKIDRLYSEVEKVINVSRIVRGEFNLVT